MMMMMSSDAAVSLSMAHPHAPAKSKMWTTTTPNRREDVRCSSPRQIHSTAEPSQRRLCAKLIPKIKRKEDSAASRSWMLVRRSSLICLALTSWACTALARRLSTGAKSLSERDSVFDVTRASGRIRFWICLPTRALISTPESTLIPKRKTAERIDRFSLTIPDLPRQARSSPSPHILLQSTTLSDTPSSHRYTGKAAADRKAHRTVNTLRLSIAPVLEPEGSRLASLVPPVQAPAADEENRHAQHVGIDPSAHTDSPSDHLAGASRQLLSFPGRPGRMR
ncbi:glycosyltransferase [Pseudozyma hubeiensis SY62]|uniref:Glycosyltransferase n=1 Tax=Pseudozyma hubeiensis (strain SY62) TaxID=1305764 RepID=R9P907_PSEHS|nr:glycosyltransferase [Pseudozyma hubeiensis SY62]GAC97853.1 glycosyltransferase [Pseudozyma hubeiensis SY62]